MFEKVNPSHPDKIADRIAGAIVDQAYRQQENPKIAVEVLIGHGECHIIAETSASINRLFVEQTVERIAGVKCLVDYEEVPQDEYLAINQSDKIRCGDNGIFKGVPTNSQEEKLAAVVKNLYQLYDTDGKYIIRSFGSGDEYIICQSCTDNKFEKIARNYILEQCGQDVIYRINPLGYWTGGVNVDSGATNRKLGSDMGRAATGGGLHGKDLSKADVAVNIYAHLLAQKSGKDVCMSCAIGDEDIMGTPYSAIVQIAKDYIDGIGGFEKFAEWGLI